MTPKGTSSIYGVIGFPIKHSLSPVFQNRALSHLGIDAVYIPFEVRPQVLKEFIEGARQIENLLGLNVTIPHKEAVVELSDRVSEEVEKIGAANTLKFEGGTVEAFNTDWVGFLRSAESVTNLKGKRVLLLGAGGSSRAVLYALTKAKAEVYLWNRTPEKAHRLAREFQVEAIDSLEDALKGVDIVVNTTSVGLKENDPPLFDYSLITPEHTVIDIIYRETPLIRRAKELGCKYQTGFPMLVYQGAESLRIWTGCEPPIKVMEMSLKEYGYPIEHSKTHRQTLHQPS